MATYWASDEPPLPFDVWVGDTDITDRIRRITEKEARPHAWVLDNTLRWWEIELTEDGGTSTWRTVGAITRVNRDTDVNLTRPRYIIAELDGPTARTLM